jgi:hypothetical protein
VAALADVRQKLAAAEEQWLALNIQREELAGSCVMSGGQVAERTRGHREDANRI